MNRSRADDSEERQLVALAAELVELQRTVTDCFERLVALRRHRLGSPQVHLDVVRAD